MRIAGVRFGRRRLAALALGAAAVALCAAVAGLLGAGAGGVLLAGLAGGLLVALGIDALALRRYQAAVAPRLAAHEERLSQSERMVAAASRAAEARERAVWEYATGELRGEPDTFVLYRIIGNDLPPRHRAGQTLENLRFILEHEPELPGCQKRWVVNRIVDPATEKAILSLLDEHGAPYLRLPFDVDSYRRVGWRFDGFAVPGFTYRSEFEELPPMQRQWALDHVYHWKTLYVMNNNGARNAALREGRGLAKWVLPWDGNCFLTEPAWQQLVTEVTARPYLRYFTVPMARILDNQALLRPDMTVDPVEEPQLVFRRDAREEFDENARYGRCPKVELFWRLGIVGSWDRWCRGPWDPVRAGLSVEAGQFGEAGWVARLYSGERELERDADGRAVRRSEAVRARIDRIDEELAATTFDATAPFGLEPAVLDRQRERWRAGESGPADVVGQLVEAAQRALPARRSRANPRGWISEPRGFALDRRDGQTGSVADDVLVLTLAGYLTGEERFWRGSVDRLRAGLPARSFVPGLPYLLDAARLLETAQALPPAEVQRLRGWLAEHRSWLRDSEAGRSARSALDHRGTWYDVDAVAVDAYLDDLPGVLGTLRRSYERIGQQELPGSVHNMQGWLVLARFAERAGQDLWSHEAAAALRRLFEAGGDPDRLAALAYQAPGDDVPSDRDPYRVRQVFDPRDGIRPFWILG